MVARRTVLTTACAALGLTAVGTAYATSGTERPAPPRTRVGRRPVRNGHLRVDETAFTLTHLAVASDGPAAKVRVRTRKGWSGWQTVDGCGGGKDGATTGDRHTGLLLAPEATGYEVALAGAGTGEVTELDMTRAASALAAAPAASMPLPDGTRCDVPYLSRAAWGADDSIRTWDDTDGYYPVQTITVHHAAVGNDDPNPAATVRSIYYTDTVTDEYGDLGYHLLIDEAGRVYEGRWSGDDGMPAFRGTLNVDGRPALLAGAHVGGYNSGNLGICLLGDFTSRQPTAAARRSLETVLASLTRLCRLDPQGRTTFVNPVSGATRSLNVIPGHRDWADPGQSGATECPGNLFYPKLSEVRRNVAKLQRRVPRKTSTATPRPVAPRR